MNETQFPWIVLVPKRQSIVELHELSAIDQKQACAEILAVSHSMQAATSAEKMNIGALGNLVPQLHIHVICRYYSDPAWPQPVWGNYTAKPFSSSELSTRKKELQSLFQDLSIEFTSC